MKKKQQNRKKYHYLLITPEAWEVAEAGRKAIGEGDTVPSKWYSKVLLNLGQTLLRDAALGSELEER